eukprot:60878-Alexandrium_andersonii.AAC.1
MVRALSRPCHLLPIRGARAGLLQKGVGCARTARVWRDASRRQRQGLALTCGFLRMRPRGAVP